MATTAEIERMLAAFGGSSAPTMDSVQSEVRSFVEAVLSREAQEEESLAEAERYVFSTRLPIDMLRKLARSNTKLLISARATIDAEREREAASLIQFHFAALRKRLALSRHEEEAAAAAGGRGRRKSVIAQEAKTHLTAPP